MTVVLHERLEKFDPAQPRDYHGRWRLTPWAEWKHAGIPDRGMAFGIRLRQQQVAGLSDHALDLLDAEVLAGLDQRVISTERVRRGLFGGRTTAKPGEPGPPRALREDRSKNQFGTLSRVQ